MSEPSPEYLNSLIKHVHEFYETFGRGPTVQELLMFREARASVALDKGDVGTYSVEDHDPKGPP